MLIGLYGDSRSGKDTTARILSESYSFEWNAFATQLRKILLDIDPMLDKEDDHEFYLKEAVENYGWDWVKKHYPYSVDMMINIGQSARDNIHPDVWIWPVLSRRLPERLVISDVRQPNEYEAIIGAGGEVWNIIRPKTIRRAMDGLLDNKYFPVTLHNSGSEDDLRAMVRQEIEYALQNRWNRPRADNRADSIYD